jgi:hypothetical protein
METNDDLEDLLENVVQEILQQNNDKKDKKPDSQPIIAAPMNETQQKQTQKRPSLTIRIPDPLPAENQTTWFRKRSIELRKRSYVPITDSTCPIRDVQRALKEEVQQGPDRTPTPFPFEDDEDEL